MPAIGASLIFFALTFLLLLTLGNVLFWPRISRRSSISGAGMSILIPARNEEDNLSSCLAAVLAGAGAPIREVLVYDDHSTDGTASIVRELAARDPRVRLLVTQPLPVGWCGKNFACWQLANAASSPWILFIDADARLTAGAPARILGDAEHRGVTFLSCWPALDLESFWEKTLMPMLNFVVFSIFPAPLSLRMKQTSLGIAHGACLLMERDAYFRIGGHSAVRGEIFEDTRLARLWRDSNESGLCLDGQDVIRVRMYYSFAGIWNGFQKNFYPAFQTRIGFWCFLGFHLALFLSPFLVLDRRAVALVLGIRAALLLRFRQPLWSVVLHPLSETILLALGISSWWQCFRGRGVTWKDRVYRAETESPK